jgi:hypothetical protein
MGGRDTPPQIFGRNFLKSNIYIDSLPIPVDLLHVYISCSPPDLPLLGNLLFKVLKQKLERPPQFLAERILDLTGHTGLRSQR